MRRLICAALVLPLLHPVGPLPAADAPDPPRIAYRTYAPPTTLPPIPDLPLPIADPVPPITSAPSLCAALHNHSPNVQRWCPTVEYWFNHYDQATPQRVHWGLHTIACESGGNPDARSYERTAWSKKAAGLMQFLPRHWPGRSSAAGFPGGDIMDPNTNIAVGVWLYLREGGRHWRCSQ